MEKNIPKWRKIYQNGEKYTKLPLNYQNGHELYPKAVIYSKWL
jgi:hypothetical protein